MKLKNHSLIVISLLLGLLASCTKDPVRINKVPVAQAGPAKTITLPVDSTMLTGSGTDEDGKVVAYLWSQVSGPSGAHIINPGSPSTIVKCFMPGIYKFQLMVVDNHGATGVDTTTVTVNPGVSKTMVVTLQPSDNPNEYRISIFNGVDATMLTTTSIDVDAWTSNSQLWLLRGLIKFDLSSIPSNAVIKSANLYLYSHPTPSTGNLVDANFGPANSFTVQQVTANWSPGSLSWSNQPATTTANQVVVPTTAQSRLDLNLDVTNMVSSMVTNNANYGFLLKLENEATYNSRIFVSSHNTTYPDKHPKLVIVYQYI